MPDSTSYHLEGYVLDTNVLSKLAQANQLDLLHQLTTVPLYITPHIQRELEVGLRHGVSYLLKALQLLKTGELQLITPTPAESRGVKVLDDFCRSVVRRAIKSASNGSSFRCWRFLVSPVNSRLKGLDCKGSYC